MKTTYKLWLAGLAAALVLAGGCSSNNDDNNGGGGGGSPGPGVAASVPDSAGVSGTSFLAYLMGLSATDETSEPLLIKDSLAVPADETAENQKLS